MRRGRRAELIDSVSKSDVYASGSKSLIYTMWRGHNNKESIGQIQVVGPFLHVRVKVPSVEVKGSACHLKAFSRVCSLRIDYGFTSRDPLRLVTRLVRVHSHKA